MLWSHTYSHETYLPGTETETKKQRSVRARTHTHTHTHTYTRMSNSSKINGEDETGNVMVERQVEIKGTLSWVTRGGLYAEVLLCRGLLSRSIQP